MAEFARRLFKVQQGEGEKALFFIALSALLQAGLAVGMSAADSLFLVKVGADRLPYVFLIMPCMMLVYISIYSYLMNRFGLDRVFDITLALVALGGIAISFLVRIPHPAVYYVVKLYAGLWYIGLYTLFWNYADSYYDIRDAKRLFPLFTGGAATGAMVGGTLVSVLSHHLLVEKLFVIWAVLTLLAFPLVVVLRRRWSRIETDDDGEPRSFLQEARETSAYMRRSPYVRLLTGVMLVALVLTTVIEFQYSTIFAKGRSAEQLAALLGTLYALVNVFNLILNFFLFNRIVLAFGVGNITLVAPIFYVVTFLFLLFDYGFPAGVLGFVAYQGVLTTIEWNNTNFLFNAVPSQARKQVRTLTEGLCEPLATAAAGIFLLLFGTKVGYFWITRKPSVQDISLLSPEGISAIGVIGAAAYLLMALFLRSSYLQSMVTNLKEAWLDFSRPATAVLTALDEEQIQMLSQQARSEDRETVHTAIQILWLNDREKALGALLEVMSRCTVEDRSVAQPLLAMMLEEEDPDIVRALLDWLYRQEGTIDPYLLQELGHRGLIAPEEVAHLFCSSDPEARAAAVVAARNSGSIGERLHALHTLDHLLRGDGAEQIAAVRALGRSRSERDAHALAAHLGASDPRMRGEALLAVQGLVTQESSRLLPLILGAVETGDAEERLVGMQALAKIADGDCIAPLLALGDRFTPLERRQAEGVLCAIGLKSVPAAVGALRDASYPYRGRSIAARALGRLALPQLEALSAGLIQTELRRAYDYLAFHQALESHDRPASNLGLSVLARFYRDMQAVIVDFVLELLTLGGRLPDFELVSASLRSGSRRERANAIETIEQGVSRPIFKMLLPLVDRQDQGDKVSFNSTKWDCSQPPLREILTTALNSSSPLECSAAAQALWETNDPEVSTLLRGRLREGASPPLFRETMLSLLPRGEARVPSNLIEKLGCLAQSSFFQPFTLEDLEIVAIHASTVRWERGATLYRTGDPADALYVIIDGEALLEDDAVRPTRTRGDNFGEEALFGQSTRSGGAVSQGLTALRISRSDMATAARTRPRMAIILLAEKLKRRESGRKEASHEE